MVKKVLSFDNIDITDIEVGRVLKIGKKCYDYQLNSISINDIDIMKNANSILQNPDNLELFSVEPIKQNGYYFLGKYGYKDENGKVVIEPQFVLAYPFKYGFAKVATEVLAEGKLTKYKFNFINAQGKLLFDDYFTECTSITKYHTAIAWDKDNLPLIVTKEGNKIDERKFKYLYPVKNDDFLFDPTVPTFTECRFYKYSYSNVSDSNNVDDNLFGLYDSKNCTIALPTKYKNFSYYSHNLVYAITANGNEIIIDKCENELPQNRYRVLDFYNYDIVIDYEKKSVSLYNSYEVDTLNDLGIE